MKYVHDTSWPITIVNLFASVCTTNYTQGGMSLKSMVSSCGYNHQSN